MSAPDPEDVQVLELQRGSTLGGTVAMAVAAAGLGTYGLTIGSPAPRLLGVVLVLAALAMVGWVLASRRHPADAIVIDGDRIGHRSGRTGRTAAWTPLDQVVEVGRVDHRGRMDGSAFELLVLWATRPADPQGEPRTPLAGQERARHAMAERGARPLGIRVDRLDADARASLVAFLARGGITVQLRRYRGDPAG